MSYHGIIAERRVWAGSPGVELSIAAIMRPDGSTEIETRYIRHDAGPPVVERRRRMSVISAFVLAGYVKEVAAAASTQIAAERDGRRREASTYSEKRIPGRLGTWVRAIVGWDNGRPFVRLDRRIVGRAGGEAAIDVLLTAPLDQASELASAITGAAFVAFDSALPPGSRPRPSTPHGGVPHR